MSANIRELRMPISFHKQSALQTAAAAADCWTLMKTNPEPFRRALITEDNGPWIGKDDEFATENHKSHWEVEGSINGYLSSEWAAMLAAFGLGKVTKEAAGSGFLYTCTPLDPLVDEIELPSATLVEAIRQGASDVLDRALIGICLDEFGFQFNRGTGLQNLQFTSRWIGCGKATEPSSIVIPASTPEHRLKGGNVAVTILGTDYVTTKRIESLNFGWRNNIRRDSGYYPGSGTQSDAQIMGRMEHGDRACSTSFVSRFVNGSTEMTNFLAQTEGTAVITVTGEDLISSGVYHKMTITLQRVVIKTAEVGNADGLVTIAVDLLPMKHAVNGLIKIEVWCEQDEILTAAA
jgi:hypothetical protein